MAKISKHLQENEEEEQQLLDEYLYIKVKEEETGGCLVDLVQAYVCPTCRYKCYDIDLLVSHKDR